FQSTPPRGRRRVGSQPLFRATPSFNPRLHAGGDGIYGLMQTGSAGFQSTPPRGRRQRLVSNSCYALRVSIHASTREATISRVARAYETLCFNPRLHAGGDSCSSCGGVGSMVSIHASTREATDRD